MRNLSALRVFAASVFVVMGPSFADAADLAGYSKIVSESVHGKIDDVKGLIAKQDAAIEIGIEPWRSGRLMRLVRSRF